MTISRSVYYSLKVPARELNYSDIFHFSFDKAEPFNCLMF